MATMMLGMDDEEMSFDSYCIVCDRRIVGPKEVDAEEEVKVVKKKSAGGAIRVKNPDGTTTTRTANGAKVTRPGLKRNPNSGARLAAVAANNNAAAKMQPLTRSKTSDIISTSESPFQSTIYCSPGCATADAGRSFGAAKDIARSLSFEHSAYLPHHIDTTLSVSDHSHPHAPPSPLFISGSDTESSTAGADNNGPACSAPKVMEYFRMSRGGPDDAWHEVGHQRAEHERQRRSSMNPAVGARPYNMARQVSGRSGFGYGDMSNDSLSSLWEQEMYLARSASGGGRMRGMTPVKENGVGREALGAGRRSTSSGSEKSVGFGTRPVVKSTLSQTSLAHSPPNTSATTQPRPILPPEFGSTPDHTLSLLQSYAAAFPVRDPSGTSASFTQRGFVFPGSQPLVSPSNHRRVSGSSSTGLHRPTSGTIRASKARDATWDTLGKEEVKASTRAHRSDTRCSDDTPRQSLKVEDGRWKIKYSTPVGRGGDTGTSMEGTIRASSRSRSRARSNASSEYDGIAIPSRPALATSHASSRTPTNLSRSSSAMPPPGSLPHHVGDGMPDMAGMRIGSAPKSGFNWDELEKRGGKTYELPKGLKIDRSKAGLFYFQ